MIFPRGPMVNCDRLWQKKQTFDRGPSNNQSCKVWSHLALWLQRSRTVCEFGPVVPEERSKFEKLTSSHDGRQVMVEANMAYGQVS